MNDYKLFDKALELWSKALRTDPEDGKATVLAQALHYITESFAHDELGNLPAEGRALAYGLRAQIYFDLYQLGPALDSAKQALQLDPHNYDGRWVNLGAILETERRGGGLHGLLDAIDKLCEAFKQKFEQTTVQANVERATTLIKMAKMLNGATPGGMFSNWKQTKSATLTTVKELMGTLSSDDDEIEEKIREAEASASGYLLLMKK